VETNVEAEPPSGETESAEGAEGSTGRAARRRRREELGNSSLAIEALADPTRRAILERLRGGPMPVKDIASGLPVTRPAVSQHLGVLKRAGLVSEQRQGTFHLYRLESQGLDALRAYLDNFWSAALTQFAQAVDRSQGRKP
jgi:DNA-binding transcriptional ArsR family regulator